MLLESIFERFPPELTSVSNQYRWAAAQGYLLKGVRAVMWGREEDGQKHFEQATKLHAHFDETVRDTILSQLLGYESAYGTEATEEIIQDISLHLKQIDGQDKLGSLKGLYWLNRALKSYRLGQFKKMYREALQAMVSDPGNLSNRGLLSILLRSSIHMWAKSP